MADTVSAPGAAFDPACGRCKRGSCMNDKPTPEETDQDEEEFLINREEFYDLLMEQQEQM